MAEKPGQVITLLAVVASECNLYLAYMVIVCHFLFVEAFVTEACGRIKTVYAVNTLENVDQGLPRDVCSAEHELHAKTG